MQVKHNCSRKVSVHKPWCNNTFACY